MPELVRVVLPDGEGPLVPILVRLAMATVLGAAVSFVYRGTRPANEITPSFPITLVLLSILIAMVTQVIGDNVARAFSLVGALSIVRFRTVVRDTQDTAYVICAVAVGMAVGANHPLVAVSGIVVVAIAAWVMRRGARVEAGTESYVLEVRVGVGHDPNNLLRGPFETYVRKQRLKSISTARQGMALEAAYVVLLKSDFAAGELVKALNRVEGVQSVTLERMVLDE
jgi:uncharacterized membrane protein YhiD involved in acid resistance